MPVHAGHVAMIEYACSLCDELIVSMSFTPDDPIPGDARFPWLRSAISHLPKAKAFLVRDDFDDETLPLEERTEIWSQFIQRVYPAIDLVVSSEPYGEPFAPSLKGATRLIRCRKKGLSGIGIPDTKQANDVLGFYCPSGASLLCKKDLCVWSGKHGQINPYASTGPTLSYRIRTRGGAGDVNHQRLYGR